jgi:integrase/recombinase XerD
MLALERHPRNHALLYLLYASGVRVSECCGLKWRDAQERNDGGQITVLGKGGKTNTILIPASVWRCLLSMKGGAGPDAAVFRSRKGAHLHPTQVRRVVRRAAMRAGIEKSVSPHWMRHAHASHALDRGAPIHLVQATLAHSSVATTGRYLHARPTESSSTYLPL